MCQSKGERRGFRGVSQRRRPRQVSRIEAKESLEQCSMGTRLMIIELRKYNEIGELLIGNRTTRLQVQVGYRDMVWEAFVTRAAVHMGVKETGMKTGHRGAYNQPPSRDQEQVRVWVLWSNQKGISTQ